MKKIFVILLMVSFVSLIGCSKDNSEIIKKENNKIESDSMQINIKIDNNSYILKLEDNESARKIKEILPNSFTMDDLNNNEKYIYLDNSIATNEFNPKKVNKGDVYLFGDNCLVIFYKTFDTSYSYTKIGHIDNLKDLGSGSVQVSLNE